MTRKKECTQCGTVCWSRSITPLCKSCSYKNRTIHTDKIKYKRYHHLSRKYGLDEDGFLVLWEAFEGKCGICRCNMTLPTQTRGQKLSTVCVDHDHVTGNLRGLLCNACNKALGLFQENITIVRNAIKWLGD